MKLHLEKSVYRKLSKERTNIDRLALLVGIMGPLYAIPQAITVWFVSSEGVSLFTWIGFLITATILLMYAIVHRLTALIISNILWIILEIIIITGILVN